MKKLTLLLTLLLGGFLTSCSHNASPEETLALILDRAVTGNFEDLRESAPVLYALDEAGRREAAETLASYSLDRVTLERARREWGKETLFLTPRGGEGRTLVLTFARKGGAWVLQDSISYKQNYAFIPLDREKD